MNSSNHFTIARVIARLNVGGPAIQAILMTDAFLRKGYRSLLLTGEVAPGESSMDYLAQERNVVPIKINGLSRRISSFRDWRSLWQLIRIFRREKPLVVHTHTAKAGALGRLAAILTRVPIRVHTFHGHVFRGYFSPSLTRVFLAIERFFARHTDCIIAISESQKQDLVATYKIAPASKVTTIPLGFDLTQFLSVEGNHGSLRKALKCHSRNHLVGWVGRVTEIKDPKLFLDCAALVFTNAASAQFVMVGDGELRGACEEHIAKLGLTNAAMVGWQKELHHIYADLDLLVLTSVNEGTPLAILEAMASGKAFVATDVGGVRDLMVGTPRKHDSWEQFDNGILVSREAWRIANAVEFLLRQPDLRRDMGIAGRKFVKQQCSQERLASDLESLYWRLARQKKCLPENFPQVPEPASYSPFRREPTL
jgi:glycosyltransferase involved in cell wall biosynthesis